MKQNKIFVLGSIAYDKIMDYPGKFADHILPDKIHALNVGFLISEIQESFGGTAGNICYSLSLLGERPVLIASAGNDFLRYGRWLQDHSINTDKIFIKEDAPTASAYIITDQMNNQITAFHPGAMNFASKNLSLEEARGVDAAIVSPANKENMIGFSKLYAEFGVKYIFDPGQMIGAFSAEELRECVQRAWILIANDYEISYILKKMEMVKSDILKNSEAIITTLGEKGSIIETKAKTYEIPAAKPRNICDPTGAGDAYRAGLIKGIVSGMDLETSGKLGSLVSVYTVEMFGTQTHTFTLDDIKMRYEENYKEKLTFSA